MIDLSRLIKYALLLSLSICATPGATNCPPDSGIYLQYNGNCYSSGTLYVNQLDLRNSRLRCEVPNSQLSGGELIRRNDNSRINCNRNNPVQCTSSTSPASLQIFTSNSFSLSSDEGNYKCCLPYRCSDPTTQVTAFYIFDDITIINCTVTLPTDITVIPQSYSIDCYTIGSNSYTSRWYYRESTPIEPACRETNSFTYSCSIHNQILHSSNQTHRNSLQLKWFGQPTTSTIFNSVQGDGDHRIRYHISRNNINRNNNIIIRVPAYVPTITSVTTTDSTLTVHWTANSFEADGYIINATGYTLRSLDIVTQTVQGGRTNSSTLQGLLSNTAYIVTIRAYQDIVGGESIPFGTFLSIGLRNVNYTLIEGDQFRVDCFTLFIINVQWIVKGAVMSSTLEPTVNMRGIYNHSLILGRPSESTNVTCVATYGTLVYNRTITLQGGSAIIGPAIGGSFAAGLVIIILAVVIIVGVWFSIKYYKKHSEQIQQEESEVIEQQTYGRDQYYGKSHRYYNKTYGGKSYYGDNNGGKHHGYTYGVQHEDDYEDDNDEEEEEYYAVPPKHGYTYGVQHKDDDDEEEEEYYAVPPKHHGYYTYGVQHEDDYDDDEEEYYAVPPRI